MANNSTSTETTDVLAEVDLSCMDCLCEAATGCNFTAKCGTGSYFCGPFHISWGYWADAGKPVLQHDKPERKGAFETCAIDPYCSANIVSEYMNKFSKDCDGDGVVSCRDYARIHKLGRNGCAAPLPPGGFTTRFEECAARLNVF
ncbi:lysozyme-like isoform X3 [Eriocheir sinensis]|uniref:lysozyme-like isoform X3 n=1 Tax=Eriocheir sinensis TaxID=95602 RepID=UPI0021CA9AF7|nr:lysozyme-like isoform X3 [Eriocheir sinensis]